MAETEENKYSDINELEIYEPTIFDIFLYDNYCSYCLYDLDNNGIDELILGYGATEADYSNSVYTINSYGKSEYLGSFYSHCSYYEAEDGNGLYAVSGHMGVETVVQLTLNNGKFEEKELWTSQVGEDGYYSNNKPIQTYYPIDVYGEQYSNNEDPYGYEDEEDYPDEEYDYLALAGSYVNVNNVQDVVSINIYSSREDDSIGNIGAIYGNSSDILYEVDDVIFYESYDEVYILVFGQDGDNIYYELYKYNEGTNTPEYLDTYTMMEHYES